MYFVGYVSLSLSIHSHVHSTSHAAQTSDTNGCSVSSSLGGLRKCTNQIVAGAIVSTEGGDYIKIHNVNISLDEGSLRVALGDSGPESDTCSPCTQITSTSIKCEIPEGKFLTLSFFFVGK